MYMQFLFTNVHKCFATILVMEPGGDPCALKCTLILTSDIVKGWYGHFKKVGHACQI